MSPTPIALAFTIMTLLAHQTLGLALPAELAPTKVEVEPGFFYYEYPELSANPNEQVKRDLLTPRTNACASSTFNNKSSGGSPLVSDCEALRDFFYRNDKFWCAPHCYGNCKNEFARHGTCIFGVSGPILNCVPFGNEDAGDLTRDSINKFKWNDAGTWKIGAEGEALCPQPGGLGVAAWAIWHT